MIPTRDDCLKDNCVSADQQFSRILRLWHADPFGFFSDHESNHESLRLATEFLIGRIIRCSSNPALHEYWCDGVAFTEYSTNPLHYSFGGGCIFSDRHANAMWLAPFELSVSFETDTADFPRASKLGLGHADPNELISKTYPAGRRAFRLYAIAHALYGSRPTHDTDWAVTVDLDPHTTG